VITSVVALMGLQHDLGRMAQRIGLWPADRWRG
jgi:hypothetical protein